jgi:2'-5' RNA ligase
MLKLNDAQSKMAFVEEIRAFVAIDLPDDVRHALVEARSDIAEGFPRNAVRWVKPQNIHLTLRFLGNTTLEKLPVFTAGMDDIVGKYQAFDLQLAGVGCFPNARRPRVLWIGIEGAKDRLKSLQVDVEDLVVNSGWKRESRRYHPHLTLGRVKDSREVAESGIQWGKIIQRGMIPVRAIYLIESALTPDGPIYTIRHTSQLRRGI